MRLNDITVLVPTRNEARNIKPFLSSLPPQIRLIVVDSSQDATPEIIATHRPENTRVLRRQASVTEARQLGAEAAQTPWLLFTDADVIFPPDYFGRLGRYQRHKAIYGPKLSTDEFVQYYRWFSRGQGLAHKIGIAAASGSNLLINRHAFFMAGGFDLQLNCNEDTEIVWRIKRCGYPILFDPNLIVYARDHRRLYRGVVHKTAHSVLRCLLLYFNLIPDRWRSYDWGYWSQARNTDDLETEIPVKG